MEDVAESKTRNAGNEGAENDGLDRSGSSSDRHDNSGGGKERPKERNAFECSGWVYHLGTNSIGHGYCHLRFLFIRGRHVELYKRDPHDSPDIVPIRKGVAGPMLMVEELGRRKVNHGDVYVIQFYSRSDETKRGEIACATAGEARKWKEAFDYAKQQAEYDLFSGSIGHNKLNIETEINLEGHRSRVRHYAHGLKKLIHIGQGPEALLWQSSNLDAQVRLDGCAGGEIGDAIEANEWKCVGTINGVRIFEDVCDTKIGKGVLMKAVSVVEASADTVFEVVISLDRRQRYEWDMLTGDLDLLCSSNGHCDVVYGTFEPKNLSGWQSNRDFVFSRQWFRGQDGTYSILQSPVVRGDRPPRRGYQRISINPSAWEIKNISAPLGSNITRCRVTLMLELQQARVSRWKRSGHSKFEKTIPYALLSQVSGLKEYIGANPALQLESSTTVVHSKLYDETDPSHENDDDSKAQDEFYDAIAGSPTTSEDSDEDEESSRNINVKLRNVSWAIASLVLRKTSELDASVDPVIIDSQQLLGSLHKAADDNDTNCWTSPSGMGFMVRGKSYLKDRSKVVGGDPLLKLISVDWFRVNRTTDGVALHSQSIVQSDAGKRLPFILIVNLQIPAKPSYCLVLYFAAERPINKDSLLGRFVDGTDTFRDSRFKLIPSIVEGYWMVKRAVGNNACILGKAVTCKYIRGENFLEVDVDIGSSSVARSVINLVLGYITNIVVDLAILIEAREESELPEFILGTVRLNRVRTDSAVSFAM